MLALFLWWFGGRDTSANVGPSPSSPSTVTTIIELRPDPAAPLPEPAAAFAPDPAPLPALAAPLEPPVVQQPTTQTPTAPVPGADTPVADTPVADTPVADAPVADTPIEEAPVAELGEEPVQAERAAAAAAAPETEHAIERGDTLGAIFDRQGLDGQTLHAILEADEELLALDILRPGNRLTFRRDTADGPLREMELFIHPGHRIVYSRLDDGGYDYQEHVHPGTWQEELLTGPIHGSFYTSARQAGLTDADVATIAKLFEAQIIFSRDLRAGDTFEVIRTRQIVDGLDTGQSRIEGVRIQRRERAHSAFLHEDGNYYDLKGQSLARAFQRYPVAQRFRISSHFNPRRVHPITRRVAPHNGTDFAMPIGSPVASTGDGVVTRVGNHPFAGRYVEIQHSGQYKTRYLHLSRVLVKRGQNVTRGQRIALSGNTGRSTGPHLHFELHVRGRPVDPMRADIPLAASIPAKQLPAFRERVDTLLAMMAQPERYLAQR